MSAEPAPDEAQRRWLAALADGVWAAPLDAESVPVADAVGRVLAGDVVAVRSVPALAVAAMDGIAVRAADTAAAPVRLAASAFAPIDTGAPLPPGFDAVVRRERIAFDGAMKPPTGLVVPSV